MNTLNLRQIVTLFLCVLTLLASCSKSNDEPGPDEPVQAQRSFGWNKDAEDKSKYPRDISFGFSQSGSSTNLPSSVDLTDKLPPVGDQGAYGTCITWSVGYGMRSYLNAVSRNLTKQQLADKNNQFSPADLWMSMPTEAKGAGCDGSNFEPAFDVLVNRGITTLQTAPYSNIQCGNSPPQNWTGDAANYKIKNYRMIADADMTVANLKSHLSQGQLISFGAQIGDNFYEGIGTGVLSSDTYLQPDMQHAYHALVLAGYDDSKGANGAFRVYNSWSEEWGDNGYIWIDYNFFLQNFVFIAFVATPDNNLQPNENTEIEPDDLVSGTDLAAFDTYDMPFNGPDGYNRQVYFNVYNSGTTAVNASNRWSVVYMYYNAFNANDYGILTHFYYTDEVNGIVTFNQAGLPQTVGYAGYCINQNIPAGKNIAATFFNEPRYEYFIVDYYLPPITGYYYMVTMADAFNNISEVNEQNNYFFITNEQGYPYYIQNGMPMGGSHATTKSSNIDGRLSGSADVPVHTPVVEGNRNAYSPEEIQNMLIRHRESGEMERLVREFESKQTKQSSAVKTRSAEAPINGTELKGK
jgi:hypothetical protein